jgi:hypothetical protein
MSFYYKATYEVDGVKQTLSDRSERLDLVACLVGLHHKTGKLVVLSRHNSYQGATKAMEGYGAGQATFGTMALEKRSIPVLERYIETRMQTLDRYHKYTSTLKPEAGNNHAEVLAVYKGYTATAQKEIVNFKSIITSIYKEGVGA